MEVLYSLHRQQKWHRREVQGLMSRYVGVRGRWCLPEKSFYTTVFDRLPTSSVNFTTAFTNTITLPTLGVSICVENGIGTSD